MADRTATFTIDVSTSATTSNEILLGNDGLYALKVPSGWSTDSLTIQGKINDTDTAAPIERIDYTDGTRDTLTMASVGASDLITFTPPVGGLYSLTLVSGSSQSSTVSIIPRFHRYIER